MVMAAILFRRSMIQQYATEVMIPVNKPLEMVSDVVGSTAQVPSRGIVHHSSLPETQSVQDFGENLGTWYDPLSLIPSLPDR